MHWASARAYVGMHVLGTKYSQTCALQPGTHVNRHAGTHTGRGVHVAARHVSAQSNYAKKGGVGTGLARVPMRLAFQMKFKEAEHWMAF
eukprot:1161834-Pelagomonas_calceolata.AAC.6